MLHNTNIICLTGGKCGSTTLNKTFNRNGYKSIKIHNRQHFINQYNYDGLYGLINNSYLAKKQLIIIDCYRRPIERKISSFFENIDKYVPNYKDKSCEELIDVFNSKYLYILEEYHPLDNVMKEYGLKCFDTFDFKKRYVIKKVGTLIFVKILFTDINNWENILQEVLKRKIILISDNLSLHKDYYEIYREFKEKYKTSEKYINNLLENDEKFKIYNTEDEQKEYMEKWSKLSI